MTAMMGRSKFSFGLSRQKSRGEGMQWDEKKSKSQHSLYIHTGNLSKAERLLGIPALPSHLPSGAQTPQDQPESIRPSLDGRPTAERSRRPPSPVQTRREDTRQPSQHPTALPPRDQSRHLPLPSPHPPRDQSRYAALPSQAPPIPLQQSPPLHHSPSYMSITLTEASADQYFDIDDSMSTYSVQTSTVPPRLQSLSHRPSSNALGNGGAVAPTESSEATDRVRRQSSWSTLRSYYDPKRSPLAISQQTSASAVRDMALRKGQPPVVPPETEDRNYSAPRQDDAGRKKKTGKIELSKLFTRPKTPKTDESLLGNQFANSPSTMSLASEHYKQSLDTALPPLPSRMPSQAGKLSKTTQSTYSSWRKGRDSKTTRRALVPQEVEERTKINVRKPPRGMKNWFDGLLEEEDEIEVFVEDTEYEEPNPFPDDEQAEEIRPTKALEDGFGQESGREPEHEQIDPARREELEMPFELRPHDIDIGQRKDRREERRHQSQPAIARQPTTGDYRDQRIAGHLQVLDRRLSMVSQHTTTSAVAPSDDTETTNPEDESVLVMEPTTDDETEDEQESYAHLPRVRDSIAISEFEDNVHIERAHAFEVVPKAMSRSAHTLSPIPDRRQSDTNTMKSSDTAIVEGEPESRRSSTTSSAYLAPPPPRPYSRRKNHTRQPSAIPENQVKARSESAPLERTLSNAKSDTSDRGRGSIQSTTMHSMERHKLMAVTEEEEVLLGLMRRKRAAMAKDNFTAGYETALALEQAQKANGTTPRDAARRVSEASQIPPDASFQELVGAFPASPTMTSTRPQSMMSEIVPLSQQNSLTPSSSMRNRGVTQSVISRSVQNSGRSASPFGNEYKKLSIGPLDLTIGSIRNSDNSMMRSDRLALARSPTSGSRDFASPLPSPTTPYQRSSDEMDVKILGSSGSSQYGGYGHANDSDATSPSIHGFHGDADNDHIVVAGANQKHTVREVMVSSSRSRGRDRERRRRTAGAETRTNGIVLPTSSHHMPSMSQPLVQLEAGNVMSTAGDRRNEVDGEEARFMIHNNYHHNKFTKQSHHDRHPQSQFPEQSFFSAAPSRGSNPNRKNGSSSSSATTPPTPTPTSSSTSAAKSTSLMMMTTPTTPTIMKQRNGSGNQFSSSRDHPQQLQEHKQQQQDQPDHDSHDELQWRRRGRGRDRIRSAPTAPRLQPQQQSHQHRHASQQLQQPIQPPKPQQQQPPQQFQQQQHQHRPGPQAQEHPPHGERSRPSRSRRESAGQGREGQDVGGWGSDDHDNNNKFPNSNKSNLPNFKLYPTTPSSPPASQQQEGPRNRGLNAVKMAKERIEAELAMARAKELEKERERERCRTPTPRKGGTADVEEREAERTSVNSDILAAWGNLGGFRNFDWEE
ncbi:hypothetical protein K402DRAFT_406192 [Aulographum hederae CBS 113979]|uniref:Uncharacterized protein n=1 Tax=Aulographum hederae CBS 113979 TaxID=1176131 RepID=A0A6G1GTY3_9PEZI|nr:hypothetical protein K402DRAFT_406192 [Aulographum hederae CBS 113979]